MPQQATARRQAEDPSQDYTAVDPQQNPLAFIYQNRDAITKMPEDKQLKFIDMTFRRFALPKYMQVNRSTPLSEEEVEQLRLSYAARMLNLPSEPIRLGGPEVKHGVIEKVGAAAEATGAGVLGGIRTILDLQKKINEHLGPIGKPENYLIGKVLPSVSRSEGKAYESAQEVSPSIASKGAAVGHQIPAIIAAEGAGSVVPKLAEGAPTALKAAAGAARGAVEGAAYGGSTPGGDPQSFASWGGALGAAFPLLGRLFGLGRRISSVAKEAAPSAGTSVGKVAVEGAAKTSTMKDLADIVAQKKFGKAFKNLSPTERAQVPQGVKEEIQAQRAAKAAEAEAKKATIRQGKAEAAKAKATEQASKRAKGIPTPKPVSKTVQQATAAQATSENPDVAKIMAGFKPGEGTSAAAPGQTIKTNMSQEIESAKHELQKARDILKNPKITEEEKKIALDNLNFWNGKINELQKTNVAKVSEGATGPKIRAKEGKPASPAQQAADRERQAAKREVAKKEEFGSALEKKAQELAGRYTSATQIGVQHIPELEDAVKEIEGGDIVLSGLQKMRRVAKITDEVYADSLKEWIMNQFEKSEEPLEQTGFTPFSRTKEGMEAEKFWKERKR